MGNQIANLRNAVLEPVEAIRDALAERLQSVHEIAYLLCNRMMANIEYGR